MISGKLAEQIVERITRTAAPAKIVLFGSQARRDCRRGSDIDLALFGVGGETASRLKEELNDCLDTLSDIDVVSFDDLENGNLKKRILSEGLVLYERSPEG